MRQKYKRKTKNINNSADTLATVDFKYRFDLSLTNCHSLKSWRQRVRVGRQRTTTAPAVMTVLPKTTAPGRVLQFYHFYCHLNQVYGALKH